MYMTARSFLDDLARVCARDYTPTRQDVLDARVVTIGISEVAFTIDTMPFRSALTGVERR